ncbi:Per1-like protein [Sarocladium strictum]
MAPNRGSFWAQALPLAAVILLLAGLAEASVGDKLPEFKQCLDVCKSENCGAGKDHTPIPILHQLLFWNCGSECDYACQHIITTSRVERGLPVVQFHGKWPFYRFLGMQEPLSVLWSLGNLYAHWDGLRQIRARMPESYTMRPFYEWLARIGMMAWTFSAVFHTRDVQLTEELDYFAAGATVLYGLYYTPVRIFRLDRRTPQSKSVLRIWTILCVAMYICHIGYLKLVRWDYTYNMAANVTAGVIQHVLWSWFSYDRYRKSRQGWAMWPGFVVAWVMIAMSMELFDFPPWLGSIDAHSLWHMMTIAPSMLWYQFLLKDAKDDIAGTARHKA